MWVTFQLLSVALWGVINVLDSVLMKHYDHHPVVSMWHQAAFSMLILIPAWFILSPSVSFWVLPFVFAGMLAYAGDVVFFLALDRIDVSITNIAWTLLSVFLAIAGFLLLQEAWSFMQSVGSLLVFSGVLILSLWQRKIQSARSLLLLPLLAALYIPFYFVQDLALQNGQNVFTILFWLLLAREGSIFVVSMIVPQLRRKVFGSAARKRVSFHGINAVVIAFFFAATYLTILAYEAGPISLVAIISNAQPFFVLFFAWMALLFFPRFAPREILSRQSVSLKILCFCIVFSGLALIAFSH